MKALTSDRRRGRRMAGTYRTIIRDKGGRLIACGRSTNISEKGVFVVATVPTGPPQSEQVVLELTLPGTKLSSGKKSPYRKVHYLARIVRTQQLGDMLGLGLEFVEKLQQ